MAEALCEVLKLESYEVTHCADGADGLRQAESLKYDLLILDVMLPTLNGFDIVETLRKEGISTPVLMLTALSELDDKVMGLDSGADDYLTKPFMTKELLARIRALLRRSADTGDGTLCFGDIALDTDRLVLSVPDTGLSVRLSDKEYRILEYLVINRQRILTREQLALRIWGFDSEAEYNNVEVYMSFVRKKLAFVGAKTTVKAVRGVGYELRCDGVR